MKRGRKKCTMYIHLLNGHMASYEGPDGQICYMGQGKPLKYATSLEQIRRERKASQKWRTGQGFEPYDEKDFGYKRTWLSDNGPEAP